MCGIPLKNVDDMIGEFLTPSIIDRVCSFIQQQNVSLFVVSICQKNPSEKSMMRRFYELSITLPQNTQFKQLEQIFSEIVPMNSWSRFVYGLLKACCHHFIRLLKQELTSIALEQADNGANGHRIDTTDIVLPSYLQNINGLLIFAQYALIFERLNDLELAEYDICKSLNFGEYALIKLQIFRNSRV